MMFATSYTGAYSFSFDGKSTFGEPELALAGKATKDNMGFHGSPPGDPTLVSIDNVWHMYYGDSGGIYYATLK
jgi:hypothetical protein